VWYRRFFAIAPAVRDDAPMTNERRSRRSAQTGTALTYQLAACCAEGQIDAMVVADDNGLPLASSGDEVACDEIAARMAVVGSKIDDFSGTLLGEGIHWQVQMTKVEVEGTELLVCAVGGTAEARRRQILRGAAGTRRILAA
jgi:hypothetical protein